MLNQYIGINLLSAIQLTVVSTCGYLLNFFIHKFVQHSSDVYETELLGIMSMDSNCNGSSAGYISCMCHKLDTNGLFADYEKGM
jgi:hypothetical protein